MSPNEVVPEAPPDNPHSPDEQRLAKALARFQPRPGPRFYARMADAPWRREARTAPRHSVGWRFSWRLAAVLVVLSLLTLLLASPPMRVTARRFAEFFMRQDADRAQVQVTVPGAGGGDYNFNLTLEQVARQAGFAIRQPANLPTNIHLQGVAYVPEIQTVILDFKTADSNQILRISQRPADRTESFAWIGASATVEMVQIGDISGEYVVGAWRLPEMAARLETAVPGVRVNLEAQWDPQARVQLLRWQAGGMFYEILQIGATTPQPSDLDKAALMALAQSMR